MFRRVLRRLAPTPDQHMKARVPMGNPIMDKDGQNGVPFYGNLYQGRVNTQDYLPPAPQTKMGKEAREILTGAPTYRDDDPVVRGKLDACPYFSLCDMCVWQGMDPEYLDPGILTDEEHQMLLLHSRAYYEKWKEIHAKPRLYAPRMRIRFGRTDKTKEILDVFGVEKGVQQALYSHPIKFDDCALVGLHPKAWATCNMDPQLREQLNGRALESAGVGEYQRLRVFETVAKMRTLNIVRRDKGEENKVVVPFKYARTLHDLYTKLGLMSYSGQIKCANYRDPVSGALAMVTLNDEDTYFDFLMSAFYNANLGCINEESLNPYTLHVEKATRAEMCVGKWF